MAASSRPSATLHAAAAPAPPIRRAFTLPAKLTEPTIGKTHSNGVSADSIEILYTHPLAKIISFSTSSPSRRSSFGYGVREAEQEPVGVLPWASPTERTMAAGPLKFYRVPGSVVFLHSGTILHAILAKSQCWCVDGETKFVLRIRADSYYRIELPNTSEDDIRRSDELKGVLDQVLQYEKTPCPFQRGFTVNLPEPLKTPIRKRPWRPSAPPVSLKQEEISKIESEDEDYATAASDNGDHESLDGSSSDVIDEFNVTPRGMGHIYESHDVLKSPSRPDGFSQTRSVTAPSPLALKHTPAARIPLPSIRTDTESEGLASLSSSIESFHSFHSFHSPVLPLPPSPPDSGNTSPCSLDCEVATPIVLPRRLEHRRDMSELTITGDAIELSLYPPSAAGHGVKKPMAETGGENERRTRAETLSANLSKTASSRIRRRDLSPMPLPANLFTPPPRTASQSFTTALVQRTCSLMLGPPLNIVTLMLRIAAKIAGGALKGVASGFGETGERITYRWDYTEGSEDAWGEDDYGIPLREQRPNTLRQRDVGGSWEMD